MGDADDSYDFTQLDAFLTELRNGTDLVMGNRFQGGILPGAMPFLHKYIGNPILSFLGRLFFRIPIWDFHCGLRGFNANSIRSLDLRTTGMEFASEMVVRASMAQLSVKEVPTTLRPDGRARAPISKPGEMAGGTSNFFLCIAHAGCLWCPAQFLSASEACFPV